MSPSVYPWAASTVELGCAEASHTLTTSSLVSIAGVGEGNQLTAVIPFVVLECVLNFACPAWLASETGERFPLNVSYEIKPPTSPAPTAPTYSIYTPRASTTFCQTNVSTTYVHYSSENPILTLI